MTTEMWGKVLGVELTNNQRRVLIYFRESGNEPIPVSKIKMIFSNENGEYSQTVTHATIGNINQALKRANLPLRIRKTEWGGFWYTSKLHIVELPADL
jgi:hypothetical protein